MADPWIEALRPDHDLAGFTCGVPVLDSWVKTRVARNEVTGDSRTFVLVEGGGVAGFHALSTTSAARVGLTGPLPRNAPDPVPLLLLGQLAVASDRHGGGIGRRLLADACWRALDIARNARFRALATHPIDEAAVRFYGRFGFVAVPDAVPRLMVLPIGRIAEAVAGRDAGRCR